jgi:DNA-binding NarL/FixJ family response regulator
MLATMDQPRASCVLLADRHHQLIESVRDMLESDFSSLFIVSTESSLIEGATRLTPSVVVLDTALVPGRLHQVVGRLRACSPGSKVVVLLSHEHASVARFAFQGGVDSVVLKRAIATDLLLAIEAVRADRRFVSPEIGPLPDDDRPSEPE